MWINSAQYIPESNEKDENSIILTSLNLDQQTYQNIFWGSDFIAEEWLQPRFKTDAPEGVVVKMSTGKRDEGAISVVYCFNRTCNEIFIDGRYLPPRLQWQGILTRSIATLILRAKENWYKVITANCKRFDSDPVEIGYFVRPMIWRNGLKGSIKLQEAVKHYCTENDLSYTLPTDWDILDLCATTEWITIRKAIWRTFPGEFDLSTHSKSHKVFESFMNSKKQFPLSHT